MTINLYKIISEKNSVTKETEAGKLTVSYTLTGTLKNNTSIINPTIRVEVNSGIVTCNYAYIPEFSRYYFIRDIVNVSNNLWEISMHCDVISSFWNEIKTNSAILNRVESATFATPLLTDNRLPLSSTTQTDIIEGSTVYSRDTMSTLLIVPGGTGDGLKIITTQPTNVKVSESSATLTIGAISGTSFSWEVYSPASGGFPAVWIPCSNFDGVSGENTATLTVNSNFKYINSPFRCKCVYKGITEYSNTVTIIS